MEIESRLLLKEKGRGWKQNEANKHRILFKAMKMF